MADNNGIATVPQFLDNINPFERLWVFRGQANFEWPLIPKAGRDKYAMVEKPMKGLVNRDLGRFKAWRQQAVAYCGSLPTNDFECLAFAQHYGLATRLLDWTSNPLVALYFAACDLSGVDGVVYAFCGNVQIEIESPGLRFEDIAEVAILRTRPFDRRIAAQGGLFTYHPEPTKSFEPSATPFVVEGGESIAIKPGVVVFRVLGEFKSAMLRQLSQIGISSQFLFPDLEGLSKHINWETERSAIYSRKVP